MLKLAYLFYISLILVFITCNRPINEIQTENMNRFSRNGFGDGRKFNYTYDSARKVFTLNILDSNSDNIALAIELKRGEYCRIQDYTANNKYKHTNIRYRFKVKDQLHSDSVNGIEFLMGMNYQFSYIYKECNTKSIYRRYLDSFGLNSIR